MSLTASVAVLVFGSSACEYSPLTAPSGSAITFTTATKAPATDTVTIDVIVLESKSGPAATTTTPGNGGQNNNNNTTATAGGGTPVHDGTLVVFTTTIGDLSATEARTKYGHATVTLSNNGAPGTGKITATSGSITATQNFEFTPSGGQQ